MSGEERVVPRVVGSANVGTLSEFLSERAEQARAVPSNRGAILTEWRGAVDALLDQMIGWLKEADTHHLLGIERTTHDIREPRLGTYTVPGLRVGFGSRAIHVEPIARFPIGSMVGDSLGQSLRGGRVDLRNLGQRYMIYRKVEADGSMRWIIVDDRDYRENPFDREHFEEAVKSLLE
jgi:hypothetical protein